jgi:hypothetical protein
LRIQLDLPDVVQDTADLAPDIPDLPMMHAENEEEASDDEFSARMSDAEIDAVNQRIPALLPVDEPEDADQDASASAG